MALAPATKADDNKQGHQYIYLTGGAVSPNLVERLDILAPVMVWEQLPDMEIGRYAHASCVQGTNLFVFLGKGKQGICSIERLEL